MALFGAGVGQHLASGGMGQVTAQTAHPQWFNTPVANPDLWARELRGTDGDPEYAVRDPRPDGVYNGRALEIFLPEGVTLPPGSMERLRARLAVLRPLTCTIRVSETRGPERLKLNATGDDVDG